MPTVISKYLEKSKYIRSLNREKVGGGLLAAAVLLYGCKLGYPYVSKLINHQSASVTGLTNSVEIITNNNNNSNDLMMTGVEDKLSERRRRRRQVPGLNKEFLIQLLKLVRLLVPKFWCKEVGLLLIHTTTLIGRTFMSIYVATMEGRMVKYIVQKDVRSFALMLLQWLAVAVPATFLNSLIRYLEGKIALAFRSRLVKHAYELYMSNQTYYRVSNLDSRLENADHLLTEDITNFTASLAHLYSHLTKPVFDCALITLTLARSSHQMGGSIVSGPLLATVVILLTGEVLRVLSPKFGALVSVEAERSAYLRAVHSRLIANAEEVAFYGGQKVELSELKKSYRSLVEHKNRILCQRLWYIVLEQFLMKYVWSGTGMVMVSLPILTSKQGEEKGVSDRTQYFTTTRNLLLSAADAVERLMSSYKEIVELAGYTHRVGRMFQVFSEVSQGKFQRALTANSQFTHPAGVVVDSADGSIRLNEVPVVTPTGDVVVRSLSVHIKPGHHLLITGPNGCGKSSMFRIICGLWPLYAGTLHRPKNAPMFYIPQRPYMTVGSLREQVIYPDTLDDMKDKGMTDDDLDRCLDYVSLGFLVQREGGWSATADWKDILSGGEKQRIAIARLFYHKPAYALLDECTSAVSIDVENKMYEAAKTEGITLLTITHRPSLWKFHDDILQFDGQGGWKISQVPLNQETLSKN